MATATKSQSTAPDVLVDLSYGVTGLEVKPPAKVRKGQTVAFRLTGEPTEGSVRITFKEPSLFSTAVYNQGDPHVEVVREFKGRTAFECDLVLKGVVEKRPAEQKGGELEHGTSS